MSRTARQAGWNNLRQRRRRKPSEWGLLCQIDAKVRKKEKRVRVMCIGIESAGNDSEEAAKGIDHSLLKFDSPQKRVKVSTQGTDAGGGGME